MASVDPSELLAPIRFGEHTVPGIWRYMLPEDVFYFRVDAESPSSCFACPKVVEAGFHPVVRCCTVIPKVPNFLIGFALMDGNARVEDLLAHGTFLPEGLVISPAELERSLRFIANPNPGWPDITCPFLDRESRQCGIYAFRNSTCSSFFCKHERGAPAAQFWSDLGDLGSQVESTLAQWVMNELGLVPKDVMAKLDAWPAEIGPWPESLRTELFGAYAGREREFFIACAERVAASALDLFSIASRYRPVQAEGYDAKLRAVLGRNLPNELIEEALPQGEPESLSSLWYALRLSARNYQLAPKTC